MGGVLNPQIAGAATNQSVHVQAQQAGACKGIVKDSTGEPLIGASVLVKGTKTGTVTGIDGDFALDKVNNCLLYTSPSPRDGLLSRMPSSA